MFRKLLIPALILAVAVPVIAQNRPIRQHVQKTVRQALKQRRQRTAKQLGLTQDQRSALKALRQSNLSQRQALRQEVQQKAAALRALRQSSNPNPTDLGNAMLALQQSRQRAQQMREQMMQNFKNSLTADQLRIFEERQALRAKRRGK